MQIKNQTILITGASTGIGKELAIQLAKQGNRLILIARRDELLQELIGKISHDRKDHLFYQCDIADQSRVEQISLDLKTKNIIFDVLIFNAGVGGQFEVGNIDLGKFKNIYDVNLFGIVYFLKYLLPPMIENRSGIVAAVSSMAGTRGMPRSAPYSSCKAAVINLMESLRIDLWKTGVKVSLIMPGFVRTLMTDNNDFYMPFMISAGKAAKCIINGLEKEKTEIHFPLRMQLLAKFGKLLPNNFYAKIMQGRK